MSEGSTEVAGTVLEARTKALRALKRRLESDEDYSLGETISRYCIVEGNPNRPSVRCWYGPCHSRVNTCTGILAMATSPHVSVWRDPCLRIGRGSSYDGSLEGFYDKAVLFWEYLVNDSPWRDVFLTKGLQEAEETGVLIRTDLPSNFVMQGVIGTRMPHEFPNRVELWYDVVQAGGDPDLAVLLSESIVSEEGYLSLNNRTGDIHDMFAPWNWSEDSIRNYLTGNLVGGNPPLAVSSVFDGVHSLYVGKPPAERFIRKTLMDMPMASTRTVREFQRVGFVTEEVPATGYQEGVDYLVELSNKWRRDYGQ